MSAFVAKSFVTAVPATAPERDIADAVARWQAQYQPHLVKGGYAAPTPGSAQSVPVIEPDNHLKDAAVNWFAEARRQDRADQNEVRDRVQQVMGRRGLLG
jgi:hypothetical protein